MMSLSVARQQPVEIAKALSRGARILIMDEPASSLTNHECRELYRIADRPRMGADSRIIITCAILIAAVLIPCAGGKIVCLKYKNQGII